MHTYQLQKSVGKLSLREDEQLVFQLYSTDQVLYFDFHQQDLSLLQATNAIFVLQDDRINHYIPYISSDNHFDPEISDFEDELGKGKIIKIKTYFVRFSNQEPTTFELPCLIIYKLYTQLYSSAVVAHSGVYLTIQIKLEFIPKEFESLQLLGYAPLYMKNGGNLNLNLERGETDPKDITFYSNGWQSWSMCYTLDYRDKWPSIPVKLGQTNLENQDQRISGRYQSEYHSVISSKSSHTALVLGFISLKDQFSRVLMDHLEDHGKIAWLCAYSQTDGLLFKNLNSGLKQSEILMLTLVDQPIAYESLAEICRLGGKLANVRINNKILAGWCSWYYYYTKVTENDMIKNLEFFNTHPELPIDLIQLDDGYQTWIGDWGLDGVFNEKFPHGLSWLTDKIHNANLQAGVWVAPFFTAKKSKLYQHHPEWALRNEKGKLLNTSTNWGHKNYGIDLTRSDVIEYLEQIGKTVVENWNFDYLKIDFIYTSEVFGAQVKHPTFSRAQMLRRGVEAIRRGIGPNTTLLGCGAPLGPCVGLVDAMRIGMDSKEQWSNYDFFFVKMLNLSMASLKVALRNTIQRSYMHNTWWINDPDCVIVRQNNCSLTMEEIKLQLTIFGLSGGQILISDDETKVDPERLNLLQKILPPYSPPPIKSDPNTLQTSLAAMPLDMFIQNEIPEIYARTVETAFGFRHLVSINNWHRKSSRKLYKISQLISWENQKHYSADQKFIVFDFWQEEFLGIFNRTHDKLDLEIPGHGCRYLGLVPFSDSLLEEPLFLCSTLHICQGAKEIQNVAKNNQHVELDLTLDGERDGMLYFLHTPSIKLTSETNHIQTIPINEYRLSKMHVYLKNHTTAKFHYELV